jgi:tetratricopeptide (TPR) repeat protein
VSRGYCGPGGGYGGGWGGYRGGNCGSGSSWSISIGTGWSDYGSAWGVGVNYGYGYGGYGGYCRPRTYYCPPPVVVAPCPPPVVVVPQYASRVVYTQPVVVERPVEVERVVEKPVYIDRVVEKPVEVERIVTPQPTATAQGAYRDRELGDAYMRLSDWKNAVRVYSRYLGAWDKDGTASRNLGLAQIASGSVQEGFRNVARGYELEPQLMNRAIRVSDLGGEAGIQAMIDASVRGADSSNSAEGWFTVAVLQSIAGQDESAVTAMKRARDAGLTNDLLDQLTLQVSGSRS